MLVKSIRPKESPASLKRKQNASRVEKETQTDADIRYIGPDKKEQDVDRFVRSNPGAETGVYFGPTLIKTLEDEEESAGNEFINSVSQLQLKGETYLSPMFIKAMGEDFDTPPNPTCGEKRPANLRANQIISEEVLKVAIGLSKTENNYVGDTTDSAIKKPYIKK